jgi:hypothetical protein
MNKKKNNSSSKKQNEQVNINQTRKDLSEAGKKGAAVRAGKIETTKRAR